MVRKEKVFKQSSLGTFAFTNGQHYNALQDQLPCHEGQPPEAQGLKRIKELVYYVFFICGGKGKDTHTLSG